MSEKLWGGIPRSEVPWFPTINVDLCNGCQSCMDTCPGDVYDWDEVTGVPIVARQDILRGIIHDYSRQPQILVSDCE